MVRFKLFLLTITCITMMFLSLTFDLLVKILSKISKKLTSINKSLEVRYNRTVRVVRRKRTINCDEPLHNHHDGCPACYYDDKRKGRTV